MTLHNIYHCIYQDVAEISPSLLLAIILIKNIQLRVAGQAFEVSVEKRLRRLRDRLILKQSVNYLVRFKGYVPTSY